MFVANNDYVAPTLPVISTTNVSSIGTTTATSGGTISKDGGSYVISRGVVWSTSQSPTIALSTKTINSAGLLKAQSDLSFMIEGHTDNKAFKGNKNDNWNLSVNRATAVARILQTKYKIDPKRIIAAGRSEFIPVDDNKTKAGRLNNRRIRIVIMPSVTHVMNLSK